MIDFSMDNLLVGLHFQFTYSVGWIRPALFSSLPNLFIWTT